MNRFTKLMKYGADVEKLSVPELLDYYDFLNKFKMDNKDYLIAYEFIKSNTVKIFSQVIDTLDAFVHFYYFEPLEQYLDDLRSNASKYTFEDICTIMEKSAVLINNMQAELTLACPEKLKEFNKLATEPLDIHDPVFVNKYREHWKIIKLHRKNTHHVEKLIRDLFGVEPVK